MIFGGSLIDEYENFAGRTPEPRLVVARDERKGHGLLRK